MRDLPYIHFVADDRRVLSRLEIAREQFEEALAGGHLGGDFEFPRLHSIIDKMTVGQRHDYAVDHHTHDIHLPGSSRVWHASSAALENLVIDIGLASSLGLPQIDVVMNSVAVAAMRADGAVVNASPLYSGWKLAAVSHMVRLRSPNILGPEGSYHTILDELRAHPHVNSFRDYLREADEVDSDGEALARETAELAERNVSAIARKYLRGRRKFYSVGSVVIGSGLNAIHPGAGALAHSRLQSQSG
jgi:hypothetical protein